MLNSFCDDDSWKINTNLKSKSHLRNYKLMQNSHEENKVQGHHANHQIAIYFYSRIKDKFKRNNETIDQSGDIGKS